MKICSVEGCLKSLLAKGMCSHHYYKKYKSQLSVKIKNQQRAAHYSKTPKRKFLKGKSKAKLRGHEWKISYKEYLVLIAKPCHYCGNDIREGGCGLDRVDSKIGYIAYNVVQCCGTCNRMKMDYDLEFFKLKICAIFKHFCGKKE